MQMLDSRGAEGGANQGAPAGRPQQSDYSAQGGQQNSPPSKRQSGDYGGQPSQGSMPEPVDDFDDDIPF
jgi:single-strand DNA-binding protein